MKLKKGSAAAKAFMAKLRAKKGKVAVKKVSGVKKTAKKVTAKYVTILGHRVKVGTKMYDKLIYQKKHFDDLQKYEMGAWSKGSTHMIEHNEKPYSNGKNVRVSRIENGTFKNFKTLNKGKNQLSLLSGYAPQNEIIIGKISTEKKLKDLAPQIKLRISRGKAVDSVIITDAQKSVDVFKKYITKNMIETQEFFAVMYLNNANKCLGVYLVGQGGFTAVVSERRLIMSGALLIGCTGFILCHNHPSGNLTPSQADKNFTKQIVDLAFEHDIKVIDHVIITKNSFFSFAQNGLL